MHKHIALIIWIGCVAPALDGTGVTLTPREVACISSNIRLLSSSVISPSFLSVCLMRIPIRLAPFVKKLAINFVICGRWWSVKLIGERKTTKSDPRHNFNAEEDYLSL